LRLQPVRCEGVFDEILPIIAPETEKNSVRVTVDAAAGGPWWNGGTRRCCGRRFSTSRNHACQAMPNGGALRLSCGPAPGNRVQVLFEDTGVGIPAEHLSDDL